MPPSLPAPKMDQRGEQCDVIAYLNQFGYFAAGLGSWQSTLSSPTQRPRLSVAFVGHKEVDKHTLYTFRCRLDGGQGVISWQTSKRLVHLRRCLHTRTTNVLQEEYQRLFLHSPFPHRGGLPGTSARLEAWLAKLTTCLNDGILSPELVAHVLAFLEAPGLDNLSLDVMSSQFPEDEWDESPSLLALKCPNDLETFQVKIQTLYYQELAKKFEYEAAERCFSLQCRGVRGARLVQDVCLCFSENLDDYRVRLEARSSVWDDAERRVVALDCTRRERLQTELFERLEHVLFRAMMAAATAAKENGPTGQSVLANRRYTLESEVEDLLAQKTLAIEAYEDFQEQLSQEEVSTCASEMFSLASTATSCMSPAPRRKRRSALSWIQRSVVCKGAGVA